MSHTFDWKDPETGTEYYIHHNSDMSGDATITGIGGADVMYGCCNSHPHTDDVTIRVPAKLLAAFSRAATLDEVVGYIEDMQ
jgi:hypothetical protein